MTTYQKHPATAGGAQARGCCAAQSGAGEETGSMRVLVACESSGVVRQAFRALGHDAWSCDLLPAQDGSEHHLQCDVREVIDQPRRMLQHSFQMLIAHPPCTYLTNSAAWAYGDGPYHQNVKPGTLVGAPRRAAREEALKFFRVFWECGIERIAIENPIGVASTRICKPAQTIQPYNFGEDASKGTCLWLKGLPPLLPTKYFPPRRVCKCKAVYPNAELHCPKCGASVSHSRPRWANQTDSGQNRLSPSEDRWQKRSQTYYGIAKAMAEQWGGNN